jgi:hypothetical protein
MEFNIDGRKVLKSLYGIEIGEDATALKDSEGNIRPLLDVIAEYQTKRLNELQDQYKSDKDAQYSRGRRETAEEWEKRLRTQYGITDNSIKGDELVSAIEVKRQLEIDQLKDSLSNKDLTEEQIKASKFYQDLELKKQSEIDRITGEWKTKLEAKDQEFQQKENERKMLNVLGGYLQSDKLLLSDDTEVNTTRRNNFIREVMNTPHRFEEDGTVVLLNEDGSLRKDQMQNAIKFEDFVTKALKNHIGFKNENIQVPGVPNPNGDQNKWTGKLPANDEEYMAMLKDPNNAEHKLLITRAYKESKYK